MSCWLEADDLSPSPQVTRWRWQRVPGLRSLRAQRGQRRRWGAPLSLWLLWWLSGRPSAALSPSSLTQTGEARGNKQ